MKRISGNYLKEKREAQGYTLREFADLIFTSKSTVQRWENSEVPEEEETRSRIASAFDMTVEELTEEAENWSTYAELSDEKKAELKVGLKWLIVPIAALMLVGLIFGI
ncbi:MAG: helix-turn-helix transcriptional regulator [Clostridia bacterium]|nr:helix-turn-helix transcriptional regulator [Clostridia bacterium]